MKTSLAFATLALLSLPALSFAQSIELKPRWIPGKVYQQTIKMQQSSKMEIGGQKMEQNVTSTVETESAVAAEPGSKQTRVTQKYKRVSMDMDVAGQKLQFDSSKAEAEDPLGIGKLLGGFVGKEVVIILGEDGKVASIANMEELMKPIADANPMAAQLMKSMFSKEMISQGFNQSALKSLPGKPVKEGDSWPYTVNVPLPQIGEISMKGSYTYKGSAQRGGAKCAEITEEATLAMNLDKLGTAAGGEESPLNKLGVKVEGGALKGTTWFDTELGMPREAQFTQNMTVQMSNPAQPEQKMEIPTVQSVTVTLTGVDAVK